MEVELLGQIGDQASFTGVLREYKRDNPDENIRVWRPSRPEIFDHNPHLRRGNRDNGRRVRLLEIGGGRLTDYYADAIRMATGDRFEMRDNAPEIFFDDEERAHDFGFRISEKSVVIDPWANSNLRRWPYDRFARLSKLLARAGWQVFTVGAGPRPYPLPLARDLTGKLSLRQSALLISRARLYVGNDSGMMHVAAAVGTPQVVLYGVVQGWRRAYKSTRPIDAVSCAATCREFALGNCSRPTSCLESITVERVLAEIGKL